MTRRPSFCHLTVSEDNFQLRAPASLLEPASDIHATQHRSLCPSLAFPSASQPLSLSLSVLLPWLQLLTRLWLPPLHHQLLHISAIFACSHFLPVFSGDYTSPKCSPWLLGSSYLSCLSNIGNSYALCGYRRCLLFWGRVEPHISPYFSHSCNLPRACEPLKLLDFKMFMSGAIYVTHPFSKSNYLSFFYMIDTSLTLLLKSVIRQESRSLAFGCTFNNIIVGVHSSYEGGFVVFDCTYNNVTVGEHSSYEGDLLLLSVPIAMLLWGVPLPMRGICCYEWCGIHLILNFKAFYKFVSHPLILWHIFTLYLP